MKKSKKPHHKSGPRLPSSFLKEIDRLNPKTSDSDSDGVDREEGLQADFYEYEEDVAEEDSKKNRRFDPVENYEYELPEDFKDEDVPSEDEPDDDGDDGDGDKHLRMLEGITGMPGQAFDGKEKKEVALPDLQGDFGGAKLSISDLLEPLKGKEGYNKLRSRVLQLERKTMPVPVPLPQVEREKVERDVVYKHIKEETTKWEPLVKRNREAPTLYFDEDREVGVPTVGAIASGFVPRTEFEKKMAALVRDPEISDAHQNDGAKLLELNKVSVEAVRKQLNDRAKMRSLLFRHEMKSKHIKKIKSKTYHRMLKRGKLKAAESAIETDPEAIKEQAIKQEFKRAEERFRQKHKNKSKWARRILDRGLEKQDDATRAALSDQLQTHARLTRKMDSIRNSSSSDESSDDDDDDEGGDDDDDATRVSKILNKAKERTLKVIGEEEEMPKSGVFSLPFMERGLKKQKEAAEEEARLAFQEYEASLGKLKEGDGTDRQRSDKPSGRKVFGAAKKQSSQQPKKELDYDISRNSDSEEDNKEPPENESDQEVKDNLREAKIRSALLPDESDNDQKDLYQNFEEIVRNSGPKTAYDGAIVASGSSKKRKGENGLNTGRKKSKAVVNSSFPGEEIKVMDENSDFGSDEEMVDGILSTGSKPEYKLPSQADLIRHAFACDDVEAEFNKDKMEVLNEENPEPEKPLLLPGWGQWTHVQQKKGPPSWMLAEHESAKRKREEALKNRKDFKLKHVIISEKIDKKALKLHASALPFPYKSKDVYEQSIRMPLGPDFNPAVSVRALNRPAVVKTAGTIIKPIKYEEIDPCGKNDEPRHITQKHSSKKPKVNGNGKKSKKQKR